MGLYLKQESNRTKLQEKIAAELNEKAKKKAAGDEHERPDGVDDSAYLEKTKNTTSLAWAWVIVLLMFIGMIVWLAASGT